MKEKLTEQALLETARGRTGLGDFGDEADWREGFQRLVQSLNDEARLNAVGHLIAFNELLRLENRLRVTEPGAPEILDVEIVKPFMVGLPRSTIMRPAGRDPANRVPVTGSATSMPPAKRRATTRIRESPFASSTSSRSRALIPVPGAARDGRAPCWECLMQRLRSDIFIPVPSGYQAGPNTARRSRTNASCYMQWHNPRERWVLKSTGYHWGLEAICKVYPDARIVMTS